jgi:hypothetical protein
MLLLALAGGASVRPSQGSSDVSASFGPDFLDSTFYLEVVIDHRCLVIGFTGYQVHRLSGSQVRWLSGS